MKVNIYIASSIKALKPSNGVVGYVIETQTSKGPATLTQFGTVKEVSKKCSGDSGTEKRSKPHKH